MFRNVNHHTNIKATKLTGCLASQRLMALYTLVSLHYSIENTRILSHVYRFMVVSYSSSLENKLCCSCEGFMLFLRFILCRSVSRALA